MYEGNNVSAKASMNFLADALMNLLIKEKYINITISDLCEYAKLSRQTFYNVFESKSEILHYCLKREYEKQFKELSLNNEISIKDIINLFISFWNDNKQLLDNLINNQLEEIIVEEIRNCICLYTNHFVKKSNSKLQPYSTAMLAGALSQLQFVIFKNKNELSQQEIEALLIDFFNGNLYTL
ncbi:TetR/AcrR family transcriptional regulator [Malacoplasma penetrans]|nr:TetR family transcriptional regulator [Malacoplasma penetrans]